MESFGLCCPLAEIAKKTAIRPVKQFLKYIVTND